MVKAGRKATIFSTTDDIGFPMRRPKGFTAIETLLAITILVLAGTYSVLRFQDTMKRFTLQSAAGRLLLAARHARVAAGHGRTIAILHVDLDSGSYWVSTKPSGVPFEAAQEYPQGDMPAYNSGDDRPTALPENIRFAGVRVAQEDVKTKGKTTITFYADGTAEAALLQLQGAQELVTVTIYPTTAKARIHAGAIDTLLNDTVDLDQVDSAYLMPLAE